VIDVRSVLVLQLGGAPGDLAPGGWLDVRELADSPDSFDLLDSVRACLPGESWRLVRRFAGLDGAGSECGMAEVSPRVTELLRRYRSAG
jgi:hypothetical protein